MRKAKPKRQPESVVFDRSPLLRKYETDVDTATFNVLQLGLSPADVVACLLRKADAVCELAAEKDIDMSSLADMKVALDI
jgi:hypothetical protein